MILDGFGPGQGRRQPYDLASRSAGTGSRMEVITGCWTPGRAMRAIEFDFT